MKTETQVRNALIAGQVRKAYELTCKKNPDASTCAIIRALAEATKKMDHVQRKHFIDGLYDEVNAATVATQFQAGRSH